MSALARSDQSMDVGRPFRWRDRGGEFHDPKRMETRHLFFTVCMVWNHHMPEELRTHNYQKYVFSNFYSERYLKTSISIMLPLLPKRNDLEPYQKRVLLKMAANFQWEDKTPLLSEFGPAE